MLETPTSKRVYNVLGCALGLKSIVGSSQRDLFQHYGGATRCQIPSADMFLIPQVGSCSNMRAPHNRKTLINMATRTREPSGGVLISLNLQASSHSLKVLFERHGWHKYYVEGTFFWPEMIWRSKQLLRGPIWYLVQSCLQQFTCFRGS